MLGRGHSGQWTMGPRKTLTLHELGQNWWDLIETPPNSSAKFVIFVNIWVPSSQNHENYEKQDFQYFWWLVFSHGSAGNQAGKPGGTTKLWQIEARTKRKRHANSHQNPLGFDLVRGCFTFWPASEKNSDTDIAHTARPRPRPRPRPRLRPPAGRRPASGWPLAG